MSYLHAATIDQYQNACAVRPVVFEPAGKRRYAPPASHSGFNSPDQTDGLRLRFTTDKCRNRALGKSASVLKAGKPPTMFLLGMKRAKYHP